jgi:class 3 adenylate cyclase
MSEVSGSVKRPRPSSTGKNAERAARILDDVFLRASIEGGRLISGARAIVCMLLVVRELAVYGPPSLSVPASVAVFSLLFFSLAVSALFWFGVPRVRSPAPRTVNLTRALGVVVDAALFFGLMMTIVAWPADGYRGLFAQPYVHFVVLVVVLSALRFDGIFVVGSAVLNAISIGVLAWFDRSFVRVDALTMDFVMIASSAVVGLAITSRARALALRGARRAVEAVHARDMLGAYLGKEIAAEALAVDDIVLGGRRVEVAVLFTDIRGFTSVAEQLAPEELVEQLNAYLEAIVRVIVEEGGVVDKYIGDGIMAVFGAPKARPDDGARALRAVRRMQDALAAHNVARAQRGLAPLAHGTGAHYGVAVAGNIGTREHAQYTLVGDVVNVAARLEAMTKDHGAAALVSKELIEAAGAHDAVPFGELPVRGRSKPVEVFALR